MIYLAIIIFISPILMKLMWSHGNVFNILKSTIIIYSIWYIISLILIIASINTMTYMILFFFAPILILVWEIYSLCINYRKVNLNNSKIKFVLLFIVFTLILNFFISKTIYDSRAFMKFAYDFSLKNIYATDIHYRYNSFNYITTSLGLHNVEHFFTVFLPLSLGLILFIIIMQYLEDFHNYIFKNKFWMIIIIFIIGLSSNSPYFVGNSLAIGAIVIFAATIIIKKNINKLDINLVLLFEFLVIFLLSFTVTAILLAVPTIFFYKIYLYIKYKNLKLASTIFIFIAILLSFLVPRGQTFNLSLTITVILGCITFIITHLLPIPIRSHAKKWKINFVVSLKSKYVFLIIFNILLIVIYASIILFMYYNNNPFLKILSEKITSWKVTYIMLYYLWIVGFINVAIIMKLKVWIINFSMNAIWSLLLFIIIKFFNNNQIPTYLAYRVIFISIFVIMLIYIFSVIDFIHNNINFKYFKIAYLFIPISFFAIINPFSIMVDIKFSQHINNNNTIENKDDFDLLIKHYNELNSTTQIYSEIETYVYLKNNNEIANLYYDRSALQNIAQWNKYSSFFFLFNYKTLENKINKLITDNNNYLYNTIFFKYIILKNTSKLFFEKNIINNYKTIDFNQNISILLRNN